MPRWIVNPEGEIWPEDSGDEGSGEDHTHPEETTGSTDQEATPTGPSARRTRANRANAMKSTGPRTEEGKRRSSRNAERHGVFSKGIVPLTKGPFAENPEELADRVEHFILDLNPRNAMRAALAPMIAALMVKSDRLDRWTAASIDGASIPGRSDYVLGVGTEVAKRLAAEHAWALAIYLDDEESVPPPDFRMAAFMMRHKGPKPGIRIEGLWDDDHEPESDDEWLRAYTVLLNNLWPNRAEAHEWAHALAEDLTRAFEEVDGLAERFAANRVLNGPVELETRYRGAIVRDLTRLLALYREFD